MIRAGASTAQLTDLFHVTTPAIYRACHREGIPLPRTATYRQREASAMVPPVRSAPKEPDPKHENPPRLSQLIATGGRYADLAAWASAWGVGMTQARLEWHRLGLPLRAKEGAAG
jgi:hypothetical protein